jgi:hypothetical protein
VHVVTPIQRSPGDHQPIFSDVQNPSTHLSLLGSNRFRTLDLAIVEVGVDLLIAVTPGTRSEETSRSLEVRTRHVRRQFTVSRRQALTEKERREGFSEQTLMHDSPSARVQI